MEDELLQTYWEVAQQNTWKDAYIRYESALRQGIAKELARKLLPEGLCKTKMHMNGTVRDWYHYLNVRLGAGTQKEHQEVAFEMLKVCRVVSPLIFNHDDES